MNLVYGVDIFEDETWQQQVQTGRTWVPETRYENIAPYVQAEFTGIEQLVISAGLRREISKLNVDDFTTLASYGSQFVEGGEPEFSETLSNIGPNRANLSWQHSRGERLSTRLQANLVFDRDFENSAGETVTEFDGYTTVDASANLKALGGDFALGLQNLTNEDYFTYYSQTAGNDTRNFKGLGRSINLSYSRVF